MSWGGAKAGAGGSLYGEIQCTMGNGHTGTSPPNRMTDTTENITFQELRFWAVKRYTLETFFSIGS